MYGITEGEWDWVNERLGEVDYEAVGEYVERAAPHVVDALSGGQPPVEMPSEVARRAGFDWKWGALAVLTGALAISIFRKK